MKASKAFKKPEVPQRSVKIIYVAAVSASGIRTGRVNYVSVFSSYVYCQTKVIKFLASSSPYLFSQFLKVS